MICQQTQAATHSRALLNSLSLTCAIAAALSPAACVQTNAGGSHGRAASSAVGVLSRGSPLRARNMSWFGFSDAQSTKHGIFPQFANYPQINQSASMVDKIVDTPTRPTRAQAGVKAREMGVRLDWARAYWEVLV